MAPTSVRWLVWILLLPVRLILLTFFTVIWRIARIVLGLVARLHVPSLPFTERRRPTLADVQQVPAVELARLIREGVFTSEAIVRLFVRHIQRVNPAINAMVAPRFVAAIGEAIEADAELKAALMRDDLASLPPFHGVPITIKECFALEGMPQTSGIVHRVGIVAEADAPVVARLRSAGFIPLGVTNLSEGCMWYESSNRVYGRTNNPYNRFHMAGGSSGGEGAIISAGGSVCGLGSDIGGSIRMPAYFNGVFGHKPTGGCVPNTGQFPCAEGDVKRVLATGPITRYACDLMPLLQVMAGPDGDDECCVPMALGNPASVDLSRLRVVNITSQCGPFLVVETPTAEVRDAQARVAAHLASLGATVVDMEFPQFELAADMWTACVWSKDKTTFKEIVSDTPGEKISVVAEAVRLLTLRGRHSLACLMLAAVEDLPGLTPQRTAWLKEEAAKLRGAVEAAVGDRGVFLFPPYPSTAPPHHVPLTTPFNFIYTGIFNALHLPVTQVPLGLSRQGLPLGVQVGAARGQDHLSIAVALELERAFGGWVPPDPLLHVP